MRYFGILLLTAATLTTVSAASAQTPQRTTATYDDWTVRCDMRDNVKTCEMAQTVQIQGQPNPLTQIAIGRPTRNDPLKIVFQVPINVWLPSGVKLATDDKDPGLLASYKRCLPVGCFADVELKDDLLKKLRGMVDNGKLQFKDAAQQDVSIPVSFKGFDQALDAMTKQ